MLFRTSLCFSVPAILAWNGFSALHHSATTVTEAIGQPTIGHQIFNEHKVSHARHPGEHKTREGDMRDAVSHPHVHLELRAQHGDLLLALGPAPTMTREEGRVSGAGVGRAQGPATHTAAPSGLTWRGGKRRCPPWVTQREGAGGRMSWRAPTPHTSASTVFSLAPYSPARYPWHVKKKTNGVCVQSHRDTSF